MGETTKLINAKMVLDATGYNNSIKGVNAETKKYQSQIKAASEGVKTFGKDSEKLGSIQQALSKTIEAQNKKIEIYKKSIEDTNQKMQNNIQTRDKLKASLDQANKKYDEAVKMYGKESKEAQKAKEEVDKLSTEHKKSEKAIESNAKQVQKYETDLNKANAEMQKTHGELNKVNKELDNGNNKWLVASEGLKKHGEKLQEIGGKVNSAGNQILKLSAPMVAVGGAALKVSADFESGMSEVQAISGATGSDLEKLKEKAKEMGATTKFSASDSAEALKYMAMAGWKTEQMLDGLPGIMNLAAASGENLGLVSDICTDAMTAFGLEASQSTHFADVLASASSNANTNVSMLGESFKYVAPLCGSLGYTAEDTAVYLGLMANAGVKGSQAGTSLKTAIVNMTKPTDAMAGVMEELGISITDNEGNMKSLKEVMDNIRGSFKNLTEDQKASAGATLFGKESLAGMLAIINASEGDYSKLSTAINNCDGVSKQMADTMNNNLKGQIVLLKSQLEGVGIQLGEVLIPHAKNVVEHIGKMVDKFSKLNPKTQESIIKFTEFGVATGLALKVVGGGIGTVGKVASGLSKLTGVLGASKIATAGLGTAAKVAGGVGGIGALGAGLGSTLLAIAPWAAAIVGGVVVVKKLHNALHDTGTEVDLFADKVTATYTNVETASGTMQQAVKQETLTISEETKKQVESYLDLDNQAKMAIDDLYINSTKITQDQCSNITQQYSTMTKTVVDGLEKNKQEQLTSLTEFFKNSNSISATEEEEILKNTQKYFADKQKIITDGNTEITKIMQDAANNHRELTEDEKNKINTIQKEMKDQAVLTLSKNEEEAAVILSRMAAYDGKITKEQASEHIKTLNKSRDDAVQTANDECSKRIAQIEKLRDEAGIISKDQASKLIKDAEKTRDDTVKAAEDTRYKAIEKIRGMYDGIDDQVDTRTGKIIDAWDRVKRWWNEWQPETKTLTVRENYVSSKDTDIIGGRKPTNRWTGDRNFQGGLTYLNERGYELYDLPRGTRIYNHDASEEIVLNTAREVAEQVASKMIGGSKGTGINVTQNIYNTVSTPSEIARQTKNNLRELALSF